MPGAVALTLDPISAPSLRKREGSWVASALDDGISATIGTVYDPGASEYLSVPNLYWHLNAGFTWAEAAYMCIPHLSWQTVVIGDPLYTPLK